MTDHAAYARRLHERFAGLAVAGGIGVGSGEYPTWEQVPERDRALLVQLVASTFGRELELADFAKLLGPARMVLDRCAAALTGERPDIPKGDAGDEAARMAQRIVDLIGHPVTDEPPHALVELDRLRGAVAAVRALIADKGGKRVWTYGSMGDAHEWIRADAVEAALEAGGPDA